MKPIITEYSYKVFRGDRCVKTNLPTREEARRAFQSLGGASEGYTLLQVKTVVTPIR